MGLLWPGLTGKYGDVFGLPFAIEGIAFFLEAILIAIYIYGWRRLKPWTHFWLGLPIPFVALVGAFSIISANAWMNTPAGFTVGRQRRADQHRPDRRHLQRRAAVRVRPLRARPPTWPPGSPSRRSTWSAGCAAGATATTGWASSSRSRSPRSPRRCSSSPATRPRAAVFQGPAGQVRRDGGGHHSPAPTSPRSSSAGTTRRPTPSRGGIRIPGLNSILAGGSRDTYVQGLDAFAARRPAVQRQHRALGVRHHGRHRAAAAPAGAAGSPSPTGGDATCPVQAVALVVAGVRRPDLRRGRGGLDRHRGRPPAVDRLRNLRTSDAVTHTPAAVWASFTVVMILYAAARRSARSPVLRAMSRRWRRQDEADDDVAVRAAPATDPRPAAPTAGAGPTAAGPHDVGRRRRRWSWCSAVTLYAWSGLADYGAGLLGPRRRRARARPRGRGRSSTPRSRRSGRPTTSGWSSC